MSPYSLTGFFDYKLLEKGLLFLFFLGTSVGFFVLLFLLVLVIIFLLEYIRDQLSDAFLNTF